MTPQEQINYLLEHPDEMLKKKPYTRGSERYVTADGYGSVATGEKISAALPNFESKIISLDRLRAEFDPNCHDVLFDENIPSITAKTSDGNYVELKFKKTALPFQKMIVNKQVLFMCGYPTQHILENLHPTEEQKADYTFIKRMWKNRNIDGVRTKMVRAQKSLSEAGMLFYMDRNDRIKARVLSYEDGYVFCSHNDMNGDRLMECVYYFEKDHEVIDAFTDKHQYRFTRSTTDEKREWVVDPNVNGILHGFEEIPLITKYGKVPWDKVQDTIEVYEIIYNIFLVIQKRHGWGILYIKGNFSDKAKKIAGSVILNDASLNQNGDAKYLTPPTPEGMLETLKLMEDSIQKGSGTTFILPKDISSVGDISGIAIQVTQSLDNEEALAGTIEWQNAISKMSRLFITGLGKECVKKGDNSAITRFKDLEIHSEFKQWRPRNDYEYNQMLTMLTGADILSKQTGIEKNTESAPDEEFRMMNQSKEEESTLVIEPETEIINS